MSVIIKRNTGWVGSNRKDCCRNCINHADSEYCLRDYKGLKISSSKGMICRKFGYTTKPSAICDSYCDTSGNNKTKVKLLKVSSGEFVTAEIVES